VYLEAGPGQTPAANHIGTVIAGAGNTISGNSSYGIDLYGISGTVIQGNRIGTNASATATLPNASGILAAAAAQSTTIGGPASGAGNIIGGNSSDGIDIAGSASPTIQGNRVGT